MPAPTAFILKGYPRLSETFIAQEILALEQAGLPIRIFSMRRPTDTRVHPVNCEIAAPVVYLPEYLHEEPLRVLRAFWRARRLPGFARALRQWRADLPRDISRNRFRRLGQALVLATELPADITHLHAHFIHTPASVTHYASLLTGLPWTVSAHAKDIWTSPGWELRQKLAAADWAVTCTASGRNHLNTLAPAAKPVTLIYHGLDLTRFQPMTRPRPLRDGRDSSAPVQLLTVGRAVEKKGLDTLVAALALLPKTLHWRWTHVGGGDLAASLKAQATAAGLADRIVWRGGLAQQDVLALYRASDVFVLPCRIAGDGDRDGLPNVLVEAQSQGLACISTPVSAIPELIDEGVNGLLAPPDAPQPLADAMQRLISDPALRFALGKAGAAKVRASFSHTDGIARLMQLFAQGHTR